MKIENNTVARIHYSVTEQGGIVDDPLRAVLHDYFAWATTTTMARYHHSPDDVPDGLVLPRWGWDGLVTED